MQSLYEELTEMLTATPLLWLSESESTVEPFCTTDPDDLTGFVVVGNGYRLFNNQLNMAEGPKEKQGWLKLNNLFWHAPTMALKRPTGEPSEYTLVILMALPDGEFVGIATKVIET